MMMTRRSCADLNTFKPYNPNIFHNTDNIKPDNRLNTEKLVNNKELLKSPGECHDDDMFTDDDVQD